MDTRRMSFGLLALMVSAAAVAGHDAQFEDWARVVSSTPRFEEHFEHHHGRACRTETIERIEPLGRRGGSGGAVIGGIAGAIIGSQVGKGNGRVAAAAIGAATGAVVGERLSGFERVEYASRREVIRHCPPGRRVERRLVGYDVVYEYHGRRYQAVMPYNPGDSVRLRGSIGLD